MSIIQTHELSSLPQKTLIYFTSSPFSTILPNSFTYTVPDKLTRMVSDLRHFSIQNFPIICYDDGDMLLASKAYCIFRAMNYKALVLYGGLTACEAERLEFVEYSEEPVPAEEGLREISSLLLQTSKSPSFMVNSLPFKVFDVLGKDLTEEKLKELLKSHGVSDWDMDVLTGPAAPLFALFLVYFGRDLPSLYLGEWFEVHAPVRMLTTNDSFRTAGTQYYDAVEDKEIVDFSQESREEEFKTEEVILTCYKIPNVEPNRTSVRYVYEKPTFNCRSCELL